MARCVFSRCVNPPTLTAPLAMPDSMPVHVAVCTEHRLAINRVTEQSAFNDAFPEPPLDEWSRVA